MPDTLLLTGSTGFLGAQIARQLLRYTDVTIIALLRARDKETAIQRLRREWWDWPELLEALGKRIQATAGDITLDHLGIDVPAYDSLARRITHIIHAAADVRLNAPLEVLREVNVNGTRQVLFLARDVMEDHPLQRFSHVSTAYVCGERSGPVSEMDLSDHFGFSNAYELSKYEAELLVRQAADEIPVSIFRPGMITGDSATGAIKTFNTLYYPLRLFMTGKMRIAPVSTNFRVNLVPVDYVAGAVQKLTFDPLAAGQTFHLTPPFEAMPSIAEVTRAARDWMRKEYGIPLAAPIFLDSRKLLALAASPALTPLLKQVAGRDLAPLFGLLGYFSKQPVFLRDNTDRLLGAYPYHWENILPPLLAFAVKQSFWHRASRTVYEQVLFRLQSKSKPVVFHNLSMPTASPDGKLRTVTRSAADLHAEILATAQALRALGIQPGDRVAIQGSNSTRYFATLVACGLVGAVSVSIYPTTPLEQVSHLLADCRARLFFVGSAETLEQLARVGFDGPVISIHSNNFNKPQVVNWTAFLALGTGQTGSFEPVDLDAPAALFYTSGTTGNPKAVVFKQAQIRWLAETLASFYPWRERNRQGAYLSCLPMSHVVEGILSAYSPYYAPAALDLYFLEDFPALPQALKMARPTIFFSVPRFFEKVRAAFLQNRLARYYLTLPDGIARNLLRRVLRRGLLRKSGLDGCRQMLVGSALTPPELLYFFQELGIPVHNAYGLTEAPLVSVNRLGQNKPETVGQLLPETRVCFGEDSEMQVSGPQVAGGYQEGDHLQPFSGGWFNTGDQGNLDKEGYLWLQGRKKDIIVTGYGEKISPLSIEARLRAIPGVSESLLVGENRPFCVALFWMEENARSPDSLAGIAANISTINASLEKPARIRRWAILRGGLTIANGYLSGSMKVKRSHVTDSKSAIIDAIYNNTPHPEILYSQDIPRS